MGSIANPQGGSMTRYSSMVAAFALLALAAAFITGCNTVKGAGQDAHSVGENVEDAAKDTGARE